MESFLLPINECRKAIDKWAIVKPNYNELASLIDPYNVLCFSKNDLLWMKTYSDYDSFYMFAAVHNEKLAFIAVPADQNGNLKKLDYYPCLMASHLEEDINLIEKVNISKISTLTKDFLLISETKTFSYLSHEYDPNISVSQAITTIQSWIEQSLDWFYRECTMFDGSRIFNTFSIPVYDLNLNSTLDKVYCFFGLKKSIVYNMIIPVINFIAIDSSKNQLEIQNEPTPLQVGNIGDFSSPCPPFCRKKVEFPE